MRFADTKLDPRLVEALEAKGIETAFPIQELTLEMGMRGQDIIGQARTGTGKTLGFGLPLLHRIDPDKNHIQALIVAPTRELTAQVAEDLQIGRARGLHVTAVYGGVPIDPQFDELKKAHVVVGTPGRLLDHLGRGTMDLSRVTELVLDEADEMLDMGFLPDVERLMAACPPSSERHTSLFSATMATAIVSLARRYMDSPSFLHAKSDEPQTADLVEQHFFQVHRMDKPRLLARIMQQPGREGCYVFSRTKAMCDRLVTELEDLGVSAIAIHGDLRQSTREKHLDKFREGKASILVATEVAARGLDVDNVTHVVNYDCPDDDKMYLHRIGRTARAGRAGVAVTFAEHNEVDRLNVIRKAVGAFDGELKQVFSTSPELQEIFDLPDETPWDHLAKSRGRQSSKDRPSSRDKGSSSDRGSSARDKGSSSRDKDAGSRSSSRTSSNADERPSSRERSTQDDRPARKPRTRDGESGTGRQAEAAERPDGTERSDRAGRGDDRPARKPRDRARTRGDEAGDEATGSSSRSRSSRSSDDRDRSSDGDAAPRTRTRTRVRSTGEGGEAKAREGERDARREDGDDESRPRARRRARGGRGGQSTAKADRTGDDDRNRSDRGGSGDRDDERSGGRSGGQARSRGGSDRNRSDRNGTDRGGSDGSGSGRNRSERSGQDRDSSERNDDRGGRSRGNRSGGGQSGRQGRSQSGRGGQSGGGRNDGGNGRSNDSSRSSSRRQSGSATRQPAATTAERRTERGDDARGDGQPRLSRRVEVEHLP